MVNDFNALESWAKSILQSLSPAERKKLFRAMGVELRKANQKRIGSQTDPQGNEWEPRKPKKTKPQGKVAGKKKMMLGLRQAKHLKLQANANGVAIGFEGKNAKIARVHHYGLRDKPSAQARIAVQYPERQLLGLSQADRQAIEDVLLKHLVNL